MKTLVPVLILAAFVASSTSLPAADDAPEPKLAAGDFVRITLIDHTRKTTKIYTPAERGEIKLPKLGTKSFVGLKPSEFADSIKAAYLERGLHTADTLNVQVEYGPQARLSNPFIHVVGWKPKVRIIPGERLTLRSVALLAGVRSNPPAVRAYILRPKEDGSEIKITGDVWGNPNDPATNPKVQRGDTVVFEEEWFKF